MKREFTNHIRFFLEDCIPPILRDSFMFRALARLKLGKHIDEFAEFRRKGAELSSAEYEAAYRNHPHVHDETDNSNGCINKIITDIVGISVCDIGCGTGFLLKKIRSSKMDKIKRYVGVDFVLNNKKLDGIELIEAPIETLPFSNGEFDTVICTHVIEHILESSKAISELRRICRRRLIIVVPREREGIYTFNLHLNFYPYKHSFLRSMLPLVNKFTCIYIGRDIYYCENIDHNLYN